MSDGGHDSGDVEEYERLIDLYIETQGGKRDDIAARIEARFSIETTILVLDIAGFTRLTREHGIVHYLAMIRRMQLLANSLIGEHSGDVIKYEADNMFAHFPNVDCAIGFALEMLNGFHAMNIMTDDISDIHASIGIASGSVLTIEHKDAWGSAMNIASKLGEDIAGKDEILVQEASFLESQSPESYRTEQIDYPISGITIKARRILGLTLGNN